MPLSCNLGTLTSWKPLGHSRNLTGLLYLFYLAYNDVVNLLHYVCQASFCLISYDNITFIFYVNKHNNPDIMFLFTFWNPLIYWMKYEKLKTRGKHLCSVVPPQRWAKVTRIKAFSVDRKNQLDCTFCILYFSSNSCSTCFGQPCAHKKRYAYQKTPQSIHRIHENDGQNKRT